MEDSVNRLALIARRQELVRSAMSVSLSQLTSHRADPDLEFTTTPRGLAGSYDHGDNLVAIRVPGFLDSPGTEDDAIQATVAHECGHWADPLLDTRRRWQYLCTSVALAILVLCAALAIIFDKTSLLGQRPDSTAIAVVVIAMCAAIPIFAIGVRIRWLSEYEADRAAVQVVGTPAVQTMLKQAPRPDSSSLTHPSPNARLRRLEQQL